MGFAKLALDDQLLAQMWTTGNAHDYVVEKGLPPGVEIVAARYVATFGRVMVAMKHPEFQGQWRDDVASLPTIDVIIGHHRVAPRVNAVIDELCRYDGFHQWWHTTLSEQNRANVRYDLGNALAAA